MEPFIRRMLLSRHTPGYLFLAHQDLKPGQIIVKREDRYMEIGAQSLSHVNDWEKRKSDHKNPTHDTLSLKGDDMDV